MTKTNEIHGADVGRVFHAYEVDPGPGGYFWELTDLGDSSFNETFDTAAELIARVEELEGQVVMQTQAWYQANCDELDQ